MTAYSLKPIYGLPRTRQVLSGDKILGHLYAPKKESEFWEFWPKVLPGTLSLPSDKYQPVCKFGSEDEALAYLGIVKTVEQVAA